MLVDDDEGGDGGKTWKTSKIQKSNTKLKPNQCIKGNIGSGQKSKNFFISFFKITFE